MTTETITTIINITGIIDMALIIFCYGATAFYNISFLRKAVWTNYSWIKLAIAFCSFVFFGIYVYLCVKLLLNSTVGQGWFSIVVIRTAISWMGIALFFASRARYNTLIHGGEKWILKQSKVSKDL